MQGIEVKKAQELKYYLLQSKKEGGQEVMAGWRRVSGVICSRRFTGRYGDQPFSFAVPLFSKKKNKKPRKEIVMWTISTAEKPLGVHCSAPKKDYSQAESVQDRCPSPPGVHVLANLSHRSIINYVPKMHLEWTVLTKGVAIFSHQKHQLKTTRHNHRL